MSEQMSQSPGHNRDETLYHLMKKTNYFGNTPPQELDPSLVPKMLEKMDSQNIGQAIIEMISVARTNHNLEMLRFTVDTLQKRVHGNSKTDIAKATDEDLEEYMSSGRLRISVGGGTHGQRIVINENVLFMAFDEKYSGEYAENFRELFHLEKGTKELSVSLL